jgi:hypothetical protein
MKVTLEGVAGFLVIEGLACLVYEWLGWFRLWAIVHWLPVSTAWGVALGILITVVGGALLVVADQRKSP